MLILPVGDQLAGGNTITSDVCCLEGHLIRKNLCRLSPKVLFFGTDEEENKTEGNQLIEVYLDNASKKRADR